MKQFYLLSTLLCALAISNPVSAQITIDEVKTDPSERILKNEVRPTTVDAQSYFSRARYRAERAAIRKERNTLEFGGGILGSVASYSDSWIETSGGDNSIGLAATLFLHHTFTKQRFTIETKFDAKFGYNRMNIEVAGDGGSTTSEGTWYKNQDEFQISTNPAYIINKSWLVGSIIKFRSQFANGYVSRSQQTADDRKSTFMSPGYLDISGGFTYTCPLERFPIKINLSPIALNATFAENDWIRRRQVEERVDSEGKKTETEIKPAYNYGIEDPDKTSKYEGGSSIQIDFDRTFGKTGFLRYRTTLYSFYGWITDIGQKNKISDYSEYRIAYDDWVEKGSDIKTKPRLPIHPIVRWENTIDIKATKYLSTSLSFQLYYNRAQNLDVQTRTLLSVGLTYTFKNKEKPQK